MGLDSVGINTIGKGTVSRFDRFCFWFVTIDLLFLPYFTLISVSFSVPIIAIWMFMNFSPRLRNREVIITVAICVLMIASSCMAIVYTGSVRYDTSFSTTIKRLIQYVVCFGYYFFYKGYFSRVKVKIENWLFAFAVFVALLTAFYLINPHLYGSIKIAINPADNHTRRYLANLVNYRFNYLWTDPNNIAYLMAALVFWFLTRKNIHTLRKFIFACLSLVIIASTTSNGGLIMVATMFMFIFIKWIVDKANTGKVKTSNVLFLIVVVITIAVVQIETGFLDSIISTFAEKINSRFTLYSESNNLSGGRLDDIMVAKDYISPLFLFLGSGKEGVSTENGHLYWICMYGFPSYIGFIWLLFRKISMQKWIDYIWIIPIFACFTMNIGIGEFKWMAIYFMLLSYSRYGIKGDIEAIYE